MAIEFLQDGTFQKNSDVWSYGVVIWELFSLGKNPYGGQSYDEVVKRLQEGHRLECPDNIKEIKEWPAEKIYTELSEKCFELNFEKRSSFAEVATFMESKLSENEKQAYFENEKQKTTKRSMMLTSDSVKRHTLHI